MVQYQNAHFEIRELRDGVFRAMCPELRLCADGSSMAEAEASLIRLLDERAEQKGAWSMPSAIQSEQDTRLTPDDEDLDRS